MAVFQVISGSLFATGTTDADFFTVVSPAIDGTSIQGLAGNDTVEIAGSNSATAVFVELAGGADTISFSSGGYQLSTILGGAGADTINFLLSGGLFERSTVDGGLGNDSIFLGTSADFSSSRVVLGGGADTITMISGNISNTFIGAGSGDDVLNLGVGGAGASGNLAEILGGGGNDLITYSGRVGGAGLDINGDSSANGGGADTITFDAILSGSTVRGKGGADRITVTLGAAGNASEILGNAGGDFLQVSAGLLSTGNLVGGGAGNDTIVFSGAVLFDEASIVAGGGADSITISDPGAFSGYIYGGVGADSITVITGEQVAGPGFAYTDFSESTATNMDVITAGATFESGNGLSAGMIFSVSAVTLTLTTGAVAGADFTSNDFDGVLSGAVFSDNAAGTTAAGITARVALLDSATSTLGETFIFEAGTGKFLFIQGGSTGIGDDLVVNFASGGALSDTNTITFGSGTITLGNA